MRSTLVQVHRDVGDVAGEAGPTAIRRNVDFLADIGAVEEERVETGLTLDRIVVVAGIPHEHVIAVAKKRHVVAVIAEDEVVALTTDQKVVPQTSVQGQGQPAGSEARRIDCIGAGTAVHRQLIGRVGARDGDKSR